jgi:hypothetical protein
LLRARDLPGRQRPTAVIRRLGVVSGDRLGVDINPRIGLGQVGVRGVPNLWLCCVKASQPSCWRAAIE